MKPAISVIIPSRNRCRQLLVTLAAFSRQRLAPAQFEVVVVADGCVDQTVDKVRLLGTAYALQLVEVLPGGPARARNIGVQTAQAPLLLFLDDDIEAAPGLLQSHLEAHAGHSRRVVVGNLPVCLRDQQGLFKHALRGWWGDMFEQMRQAGHRFSYTDLLTGNVSLTRQLFEEVGGFNETLRCHEDYELGIRLLNAGAELSFCAGARGIHHDHTDLPRALERKRQEGRADVQLARLHPAVRPTLLASRLCAASQAVGGSPRNLAFALAVRSMCALAIRAPRLGDPLVSVGLTTLPLIEQAGIRRGWRLLLDALMAYSYWRGVALESRDPAERESFTRYSQAEPDEALLTPLDLSSGLIAAANWVDQERPIALRLLFKDRHIGDLPPQAGAERLRGVHLRRAIATSFARRFLEVRRECLSEPGTVS